MILYEPTLIAPPSGTELTAGTVYVDLWAIGLGEKPLPTKEHYINPEIYKNEHYMECSHYGNESYLDVGSY